MKPYPSTKYAGFTLTEILVAVSVFTVLMTMALTAFSMAGRRIHAGTQQVILNNTARQAQQRIARIIEQGKTVALENNQLVITQIDFTSSALAFEPSAQHPGSLKESVLAYYPDITDTTNRVVIANHVRTVGTNEIFRILPMSPVAAQLTFHIGLGPLDELSVAGPSLSGIDVRMSSTPRNRQRWYD